MQPLRIIKTRPMPANPANPDSAGSAGYSNPRRYLGEYDALRDQLRAELRSEYEAWLTLTPHAGTKPDFDVMTIQWED